MHFYESKFLLSGDTLPFPVGKRGSVDGGGVIRTAQRASEMCVCVCVCVQGAVKGWTGVIVLACAAEWWDWDGGRRSAGTIVKWGLCSSLLPASLLFLFFPYWSRVTVATQPLGQEMQQSLRSSPAMGRDFLNGPSFLYRSVVLVHSSLESRHMHTHSFCLCFTALCWVCLTATLMCDAHFGL